MWTAVERVWTALLACPLAGRIGEAPVCTNQGRTGRGTRSFGTVYRHHERRAAQERRSVTPRTGVLISPYTACGQPVYNGPAVGIVARRSDR